MQYGDYRKYQEITNHFETNSIGQQIFYFDKLDSTNNYSKRIAAEGAADGTVVIAGSQGSGRGRLGKEWHSPYDNGIYMSIILKPELLPVNIQIITLAASVAVAEAILKVTGIKTGIKWPNDILVSDKKLCGILTEMVSENGMTGFLVVGIGINVSEGRYVIPAELIDKATYIQADRFTLVKEVLFEMDLIYKKILAGSYNDIIDKCKEYSVTIGREVRIISEMEEFPCTAVDITYDGMLVVVCPDGTRRSIMSGEVSVRGMMGYV